MALRKRSDPIPDEQAQGVFDNPGLPVKSGGGSGGFSKKGIVVSKGIPADASRKERELERAQQQQAEKFTKGLPTGGLFGRGTITSEQRRAGEALRKLRSEGKITEAEFRASFEAAPTQEEQQAREAQQAEGRRAGISEEIGSGDLREELQQKIDQPQDITPRTVSEILGNYFKETQQQKQARAEENRIFFGKLFAGKATKEEIVKNAKEFGLAAGIVGGAIASPFLLPHVAGFAARTVIGKVVSGQVGKLATTGAAIGLSIVGAGAITDIERGEIQTQKEIITGMVEEGERIEADVRNGLDPAFAIERFRDMSNSLDEAERIIHQKGDTNIKYRSGREYLGVTQDLIGAREALRRRVRATENIAVTGTAALNSESLMQSVGER